MKVNNISTKCLLALFSLSTLAPAPMHGINNGKDEWGDKCGPVIAIGSTILSGTAIGAYAGIQVNKIKHKNDSQQITVPDIKAIAAT